MIVIRMKKLFCLLLVALLVFSAIPFAFADETTEETRVMRSSLGAKVRLLQLEKSITRAILKGELIVEVFENASENVTNLESILGDLIDLREEVQGTDPDSNESVKNFIDYKKRAIILVKAFRDRAIEMKESLDEETLNKLKADLRKINGERDRYLRELKERIRSKIREHNGEIIEEVLGLRGRTLKSQVQSGELTKAQIKERVREFVSEMPESQRQQTIINARNFAKGGRK